MQFVIPFPVVNPEIELTVKRMPEAVKNNARIDARGTLKRAGVLRPTVSMFVDDPDAEDGKRLHPEWEEYNREFNAWFAYHLADQGRDLFTGWKALDGGEIAPFSKAAFADFVAGLDLEEKQMLGFSYLIEVMKSDQDQEGPAEKNAPTEPAS